MKAVATFDIGTTAAKAVLVGMEGQVLAEGSRGLSTRADGGFREQDPLEWWAAFTELSRELAEKVPGVDVTAVCMSGQMQDVIPVGEDLAPLRPAILYSDGRADEEAARLSRAVGAERLQRITANPFDGSIPLAKLLWLREHEPEVFHRARSFLISSKDYVAARLTGVCAGDRTACSTAGAMDLETGAWSDELLGAAGVRAEQMPLLLASHERVGAVTAEAAALTGYREGTPVYAGAGDAGATSLASGLTRAGQYNINLGTSGWVATVSDSPLPRTGVFNLAAMPRGRIINVVPFLNGANVHKWISGVLSADGAPDYGMAEALLAQSVPGAHGVLALPYLTGERFPVLDARVRGAFIGLTPETSRADLVRAMLEGVGCSIRAGMAQLPVKAERVSLIGGGARAEGWCRILADVLGLPIHVFRDAEHLPARAIAAAALLGEGLLDSYDAFTERLLSGSAVRYDPDPASRAACDALFARHQKLYPAIASI